MQRSARFLLIALFVMPFLLAVVLENDEKPPEKRYFYLPLLVYAGDGSYTITPTPTVTPGPPPTSGWLTYLNSLRSMGKLPSVAENANWSNGCRLHAQYMVKTNLPANTEDPASPWYTLAGEEAASNSNLMVSPDLSASDNFALDSWMRIPFHGIGIIDPRLAQTGFGSYRETKSGIQMGACMDILRGLGSLPKSVHYPIYWPGNNAQMPFLSYGGLESPNPLASCSGYTAPAGPPIYLQIGSGGLVPAVKAYSFKNPTASLEVCEFDQTNYTNPIAGDQALGRNILSFSNAIILMPREPLAPGTTYTATVTTTDRTYTWAFTTK